MSHPFGMGRCTVCEVIHDTVNAIMQKLKHQYIFLPVAEAQKEVINGFETKWGFPQCVGALNGSYIPVQGPFLNHTDYFNRKSWYSVLNQAVVAH